MQTIRVLAVRQSVQLRGSISPSSHLPRRHAGIRFNQTAATVSSPAPPLIVSKSAAPASAPSITQSLAAAPAAPASAPSMSPPAGASATASGAAPQVKTSRFARRPKVDPITITDAAVKRIKTLLDRKPEANGVRLGVRTRGCNGLSYTLDYLVGEPKTGEDVIESRGVKVVIEPKALIHLIGTTMDYKEDALAAEFVFQNPNAKGSCGCGESFNV